MRRIAVLASSLLIAATCHAAPATRESVEALFALMNLDQSISQTVDKMQTMTKQSLAAMPQARSLTPAQRARFDDGVVRVDAMMRDEMTWARLGPEFVEIYSSTFTQDEIDGQIAFYRTPAGQAVIAKTPQLTDKTVAVMQARMQVLLPRIQETMQSAMKGPAPAPN